MFFFFNEKKRKKARNTVGLAWLLGFLIRQIDKKEKKESVKQHPGAVNLC
jgi:hypothetical protein